MEGAPNPRRNIPRYAVLGSVLGVWVASVIFLEIGTGHINYQASTETTVSMAFSSVSTVGNQTSTGKFSSIQTTIASSQNSTGASQSTTQSTCSAGGTVTVTVGSSGPPCGCEPVESNANGTLYVSPNANVGDNVCVEAFLKGAGGVFLSIANSSGSVVFSSECVVVGGGFGGGGPSPGDSCTTFWDTSRPDPQGMAIVSETYVLSASVSPSSSISLEANFTLY